MTRQKFFHNLDFSQIANDPEFKEASVRSFILDPLIRQLGYSPENGSPVNQRFFSVGYTL
ncbi:MAG: hypothetical protein LBQ50_00475 [Planctomycetaceae bacterium]|jgi:hypothetical protein|nr:hypothetical protein [Planctomycetaceae bacterium]